MSRTSSMPWPLVIHRFWPFGACGQKRMPPSDRSTEADGPQALCDPGSAPAGPRVTLQCEDHCGSRGRGGPRLSRSRGLPASCHLQKVHLHRGGPRTAKVRVQKSCPQVVQVVSSGCELWPELRTNIRRPAFVGLAALQPDEASQARTSLAASASKAIVTCAACSRLARWR
jgi:hypothetical protein